VIYRGEESFALEVLSLKIWRKKNYTEFTPTGSG